MGYQFLEFILDLKTQRILFEFKLFTDLIQIAQITLPDDAYNKPHKYILESIIFKKVT